MAATDRDSSLQVPELNGRQLTAINSLVGGASDQAAADAAGVHRVTVTRWRLYHPGFRAALNERRQEMWGANVDRMRALLPKALERIEAEITKGDGDWRAAAELLELAGAGGQAPVDLGTPTTAQGVLFSDIVRRRKEMLQGVVDLLGGGSSDAEPSLNEWREQLLREYGELGAFEEG